MAMLDSARRALPGFPRLARWLRYIAQDLIHEELARLSSADPSASSPAA
jgi:hypothetical protein